MLFLLMASLASPEPPAAAQPPPPLRIDVLARPCKDDGDADVTVCARPRDDFRIDPNVLAGQRAREALPVDTRSPQERSQVADCTKEVGQCQGGGVIPILPGVVRTVTAVVLAAKGEDWRQPFRDKPDEYQAYRAYQAEQARRKSRVSVQVSAGSGTTGPR
ncbi:MULTISPECIES: hypothetical protein [Sphingomonas]|uniref:hypothetical protein n=1 Tax=Sphingomonas TaxID=13687 RepID=UPI00126A666C|nr:MULTISPECIES: hypothetical protein [Sphingomonas]